MVQPFLELERISKSYPGVQALSDVGLSAQAGEVIGLIGENGAGKSTLMKILGGVTEPTAGVIRIDGTDRSSLTVEDAIAAGIAFVHQELNLFDNLDVAANVFIGREPRSGWPLRLIDRKRLHDAVRPLLDRLGADFAPDTSVAELSIAQRQLLEIAKALSLDARIVIMDEPTSSLTISETRRLLSVVEELKRNGVAIIFISHRLNEVKECADRVVVLRDGRVTGRLAREEISHDAMIRLMIGRDLKSLYSPPAAPPSAPALELRGLRTPAFPDQPIELVLNRGEILGLAGLIGAGRTELARAVFGIDRPLAGEIRLDGKDIAVASPSDAIRHGIYLVPEDRKQSGLILEDSIAENISLPNIRAFTRTGLVRPALEERNANEQARALQIKAPTVATPAGSLSGGNQQKVVLAKWLSMKPQVIIFDEPTRGIDVGSKSEIYLLMRSLADNGVGVLMISSDMEEVIGVSDRMAVMHEGAIAGILTRDGFNEESVMQLAVGHDIQ
ncbi:MAG TPA: sugar ABC transporter ATP-binding protein [Pararhizobium sp.]|nr:sugar ABC transporter ATP-binding protein [Pararhizobium sp.]